MLLCVFHCKLLVYLFLFSKRVNIEELRNGDGEGSVDDDVELPGGADPNTVFKPGELGNYEPKEEQARPGKHGTFVFLGIPESELPTMGCFVVNL